MTEFEQLIQGVREEAALRELFVWEDVPAQVPFVDMPTGSATSEMLDAAVRMGVSTIYVYLDDEEGAEVAIAGFAKEGIFHRLIRVADQPLPAFDDDEEDDDEEDSFWASSYGPAISYEKLPSEHQALVDAILAHEDYDPDDHEWEMEVLNEIAGDIDDEAYEQVKEVAEFRFRETLDSKMDTKADRTATSLAKDSAFDPLLDEEELEKWVLNKKDVNERRVARRVVRSLRHLAHTSGLWDAAHEAIRGEATAILDGMPGDLRDRLGFATRNAARAALLEPYLKQLPEARQEHLLYRICQIEEERDGIRRQKRYSSAVAILMKDHGESKAATGRILGLSTAVIDRLLRDFPKRINIKNDEVLANLDSRLGTK